jgi:2-isopropylmalate synthase
MATPNVYADRIEWFCRNVSDREQRIISLHTHNDRGTAVAATELAMLAGADRVEGTLFGNGERTGNVDILTLAMNLFSQGIDPKLDVSGMEKIVNVYERCTRMPVHPRHPYAGELVYTAFSGSHQDAINKGMKAYRESKQNSWEVPYLPIDPGDVGRTFENVIRINSQSGKGGVAYVMEKEFGLLLPRDMQPEFSSLIQALSESAGGEVSSGKILSAFEREYLMKEAPLAFKTCRIEELPELPHDSTAKTDVRARITVNSVEREVRGTGNGPLDAFCRALKDSLAVDFTLMAYHEHALGQGSDSKAVAYVQIRDAAGERVFGAGVDTNISIASLKAVVSGLNRSPRISRRLCGAAQHAGTYSGE